MRTTMFFMCTVVCIASAMTAYQCSPAVDAKLVTASVDLIKCVDSNLDKTPEEVAVACGIAVTPDLISLLAERKSVAAMKKSGNCVVVVASYDAGAVGK